MRAFIIRPFGKKEDAKKNLIDFDEVEAKLIDPVLDQLGVTGRTTGEIVGQGNIRTDMFERLLTADLVVADLSIHNANVFYELGIRHALNRHTTILMRQPGTKTPFNIQGFQMLDYDPENTENIEKAKLRIGEFIKNGLSKQIVDSPVYGALDNLRVERKPRNIEKKETASVLQPRHPLNDFERLKS